MLPRHGQTSQASAALTRRALITGITGQDGFYLLIRGDLPGPERANRPYRQVGRNAGPLMLFRPVG